MKNTYLVCQQISGMSDKKRFNMALSKNDRCLFGNSVNKILLKSIYNPKVILAVMNSTLIDWYFRKTSTNNHVNIYELEQIPIPTIDVDFQKILNDIIDGIVSLKMSNPNNDIIALEKEIDSIIYQLYGLTDAEIKIIEQSF